MEAAWHGMKKGFWLAAGIFFFGLLCGAILPSLAPEQATRMMHLVNAGFEPVLRQMGKRGAGYDIVLVFLHNLQAAMVMIALGFTVIYPGFSIFVNGSVVGLVLAMAHRASGFGLGRFLLLVLPHGVFELPALFMAASIAWRLGSKIWRRILGREGPGSLRSFLAGEALRPLVLMIGLFALASFMEISVSAVLAGRFRTSFTPGASTSLSFVRKP